MHGNHLNLTQVNRTSVVGQEEGDQILRIPQTVRTPQYLSHPFVHGRRHGAVQLPLAAGRDLGAHVHVLLGSFQRAVHGLVRQEEEQRLALVVALKNLQGFLGEEVRRVGPVAPPIDSPVRIRVGTRVLVKIVAVPVARMVEIPRLTIVHAVERVEAAVSRGHVVVAEAEVPLAHHVGLVAQALKVFRQHILVHGHGVVLEGGED